MRASGTPCGIFFKDRRGIWLPLYGVSGRATSRSSPAGRVEPVQCLVIYDIGSDRVRRKIADICLDYGLERIQFSAFMGNLNATHQTELYRLLQRALGKERGKIQI